MKSVIALMFASTSVFFFVWPVIKHKEMSAELIGGMIFSGFILAGFSGLFI